jgi:D-aminopeptidase
MTDLDTLALRRHARRLLAPWEGSGPGATLGIVHDGALVLHESAGLASIEHGIPIGPETRFRIASVSKQFTCAAILLLAAEGRLSVEDPIHRHLPWLPDFGAPISIDQLMHNTSGLRDMLELMRLGGADLSQPWAQSDLLAVIGRQRSLNFTPGSRFRYSNTGFLLLGRIVEVVGGLPLAEFLDRRIFAPLGMTRTRHTPGCRRRVASSAPRMASRSAARAASSPASRIWRCGTATTAGTCCPASPRACSTSAPSPTARPTSMPAGWR